MASAFGHALASTGISTWNRKSRQSKKFWIWMAILAIFPDIDAIGYQLGVPYDSTFGHRGFTHSLLFAVFFSGIIARFTFPNRFKSTWFFFALSMLSHGLLDACTTGGMGVGFFIPFSNERYFFPDHPILVSPMGVGRFFSMRGASILLSEAFWIGIPVAVSFTIRKLMTRQRRSV